MGGTAVPGPWRGAGGAAPGVAGSAPRVAGSAPRSGGARDAQAGVRRGARAVGDPPGLSQLPLPRLRRHGSCPVSLRSGSVRCLPGRGFLSVKQKTTSAFGHAGSRACVWSSVTHRGIISLGGIEEPEQPDIAQLSLTKDEK